MNDIGDTFRNFIAGVVGIGLIAAVGLHAAGLGNFVSSVGNAGSGLENTVIKG
jgi:hypothetical protein